MGKALYRKYRSKKLSEVVGQDHITTTLENAIKKGKISHAYLFTGPKGVGKTSVARILAHEINKLPYDEAKTHLDIIEIDAASNRRIDEIRDLRDKVNIAPSNGVYKVYIIDEVHMLTREAFNALLKTLEEPPAHVIFILATTEAHKLPETIVSRTQRHVFRPISTDDAAKHLSHIAKQEGIDIDKDALQIIAEHGHGSFRDSISMLDQLATSDSSITAEYVQDILGIPPTDVFERLVELFESGDSAIVLESLEKLHERGYQASLIASGVSEVLRQKLIDGSYNKDRDHALDLLQKLLEVPASRQPQKALELAMLSGALKNSSLNASVAVKEPVSAQPAAPPKQQKPAEPKQEPPKKPAKNIKTSELWAAMLDDLRGNYNTLYGIARMAKASFKDDTLTLAFAFPFHMKRCNEDRNRKRLQETALKFSNQPIEIICVLDKDAPKKPVPVEKKPEKQQENDTLESITSIFGGGEIVEE